MAGTGAVRDGDAVPLMPGYTPTDIYLDDYSIYWKIRNNVAPIISSKSATNQITGNTTTKVLASTGAENNCPTGLDGNPSGAASPPTWW